MIGLHFTLRLYAQATHLKPKKLMYNQPYSFVNIQTQRVQHPPYRKRVNDGAFNLIILSKPLYNIEALKIDLHSFNTVLQILLWTIL